MKSGNDKVRKIFISSQDLGNWDVIKFLESLHSLGMIYEYADDYCANIQSVIARNDIFVAVISEAYIRSKAMAEQVQYAVQLWEEYKRPLLFIFRIDKTPLFHDFGVLTHTAQELPMKPGRAAAKLLVAKGKKPIEILKSGIDAPDFQEYMEILSREMGLARFTNHVESSTVLRILFRPTFDPECVVEIRWNEQNVIMVLISMQTNVEQWECYVRQSRSGKWHPLKPAPDPPELWKEEIVLPHDVLFELKWMIIDSTWREAMNAQASSRTNSICDGMGMDIDMYSGGKVNSIFYNCPDLGTPIHTFVSHVLILAKSEFILPKSKALIEKLLRYTVWE